MKNPIEKRLQVEGIKRLAETFLGKKNFSSWAIFYASLIFTVTSWLPDGINELGVGSKRGRDMHRRKSSVETPVWLL